MISKNTNNKTDNIRSSTSKRLNDIFCNFFFFVNFFLDVYEFRIQKELVEITMDPPENCSAAPKGDNLYEWESTITGPPNSPYTGGRFQIDILFPSDYPYHPPRVYIFME
jgi:hypothetical protein